MADARDPVDPALSSAWRSPARRQRGRPGTSLPSILGLSGKPVPVSANVLSEHEIERLDGMPAQSQAVLLLERTLNHYRGAAEQIAARVGSWRGH